MIALMAMLMRIPAVLTAQEKITFQSQRESNTEVYVMHPDGSNQFRLTGSSAFDGSLSFPLGLPQIGITACLGVFSI